MRTIRLLNCHSPSDLQKGKSRPVLENWQICAHKLLVPALILTFFYLRRSLKIASKADDNVGSREWAVNSKRRTGMGTDKDYLFVAEMVEWAGASVPHR